MSETVPPELERISHYRLVARLGRGAMGEVYRAIDERLGRPVALKLLPRARAENADMQARLLREAQAASALNHPGIVTIHDVGAWHGQVFMVMELVDGERLSDLARQGIPVEEALRLVAEAADALGAAHAREILHRDIKSDNLMRTREGRLKVLDFGLAKLRGPAPAAHASPTSIDVSTEPFPKVGAGAALAETLVKPPHASVTPTPGSSQPSPLAQALESSESDEIESQPGSALTPSTLTLAGQLVGTPAYMAPEQTRGGSGDAQSEVFSLGVVLYELLVGHRPFDRPTIQDTLEAVRSAPISSPSQLAPERRIPPLVDSIVLRALERDRTRRFPDMATFATAARHGRSVSRPMDALRSRRRGTLAIAAALAFATILGGAVLIVRRPAASPVVVRSTRRITFDLGCEEYPTFTPDGKTLVYDGLADGDYEILALDLETSGHRRLTHQAGWDYGASVSPDGKQIAFVHLADRGRELWLMPTAGDREQPRMISTSMSFPTWTADGAVLVSPTGDTVVRWDLSGAQPISTGVAALPQGTILRYLSTYRDGQLVGMWQPSQQALEFTLGEIPAAGPMREIETKLALDQVGLYVPPSQDGFYYARHGGTANELLRRPRAGGPPLVVPGGISASSGFSISADGRRLAYSTCRESNYIARLRPGAAAADLMPRGAWRDRQAVQIDHSRLVYTSDRAGSNQVWLLDLDKHETRPLTGRDTLAPAVSAAKPWTGWSFTSLWPSVRMMRQPPAAVPAAIVVAHKITTHDGTLNSGVVRKWNIGGK